MEKYRKTACTYLIAMGFSTSKQLMVRLPDPWKTLIILCLILYVLALLEWGIGVNGRQILTEVEKKYCLLS